MKYTVRPISDRTPFTGQHRFSQFQSSWMQTERLLLTEVKHLAGRDLVLEPDIREQDLRLDGTLRANARPSSPTVRVAFDSKHGPLTYGTDRFYSWQDNVRAIALGLEALRKVDRYGITRRGEQYTGWKQLPGTSSRETGVPVMDKDLAWSIIGSYQEGPIDVFWHEASDDDVRKAYRRARAANHPDRCGGDQTGWDLVEAAARVLGLRS